MGKRAMLETYREARKLAFTPDNIAGGWHATGLWPINKQKPLRSPLLLENNKAASIPPAGKAGIPQTPLRPQQPPRLVKDEIGVWKTPYKVKDLAVQFA